MRFDDDDDDDEDPDEALKKVAMDEIQRISRMDEWIPSYHNILTVTALECHKIFAKTDTVKKDPAIFMHYTRPGHSDDVRLKAFSCVVELGYFAEPGVLRLLFYVFSTDISPYFRDGIWRLIWLGLGQAAIGVTKKEAEAAQQEADGLVIEGGTELTEARAKEIARTESVPGALAALKTELGDNDRLKQALRNALK
jgi:transcription initiation factor TFIID subunit 2